MYVCRQCHRWLQSVDSNNLRTARKKATTLYCPNCNIRYRNPYYNSDKTPEWKKHKDLQQTSKGTFYRLSNADNGNTLILFHYYNWYPPTEKEIFNTKDFELIDLYKKIDCENTYLQIKKR